MPTKAASGKPWRSHGEGSIRKRGRTYQAQLMLDGVRHTATCRTKSEALTWIHTTRESVKAGTLVARKDTTVGEYLDYWLTVTLPGRPANTQHIYRWCCGKASAGIGELRLQELQGDQVQGLYATLQATIARSSVRHIAAVLHTALEDAVAWKYITANPTKAAHPPKAGRATTSAWEPAQARAFLLGAEQDRLRPLWYVAVYTGLRISEICGLLWSDLDLDSGRISVVRQLYRVRGKGLAEEDLKSDSSKRTVWVPKGVCRVLREWRAQQAEQRAQLGEYWKAGEHVFSAAKGGPCEQRNVNPQFLRLVAALGLPRIRFHDLRHTAASLLINQGVPLPEVQRMLGHSTIQQTAGTYGHLYGATQQQTSTVLEKVLTPQ